MHGRRIFTINLALCAGLAAQDVYLPLDVGNQWIYRAPGPASPSLFKVEVERAATIEGREYALVRGFPSTPRIWLRADENGRLWMWDEEARAEHMWLDAAAKPGEHSETGVDPCNPSSEVLSREAKYSGPLGEFDTAIEIRYAQGSCADAGLEGDVLLPWVGIARRVSQTLLGPQVHDLIYARLGTATVVAAPETSFSLSLDRAAYVANLMPPVEPSQAVPFATARLTLRHTHDEPLELEFPSAQIFEMVLWNEEGRQVWRWSEGRTFPAVVVRERIARGEKNWVEAIRLAHAREPDQPLPAGRYVLEAWLTVSSGRNYTASVAFDLIHAH